MDPHSFPKFTIAPAGGTAWSSSDDLVGLSDIFMDDFFPSDLNYAAAFQMADASGGGDLSKTSISPFDVAALGAMYEQQQQQQQPMNYPPPPMMMMPQSSSSSVGAVGTAPGNSLPAIRVLPQMSIQNLRPPPVIPGRPTMQPQVKIEKPGAVDLKGRPAMKSVASAVAGASAAFGSGSGATGAKNILAAYDEYDSDDDENGAKKKRKGAKTIDIKDMTEQQRIERRERNREHAKRSRIRKMVLLDTLQAQLSALRNENVKLRRVVVEKLPNVAQRIFECCTTEESLLLADGTDESAKERKARNAEMGLDIENIGGGKLKLASSSSASASAGASGSGSGSIGLGDSVGVPRQHAKILMEPDFRLIEALIHSQQNFVLSDPSLPDNPIVYCSDGFLRLTGYSRSEVLGRNCRFLQGPGTDQAAVEIIRKGIEDGRDVSVCLLNYKADGSSFWNQFFIGALRDADGSVVNHVGVQCEVNILPIEQIKDRVKRLPIPDRL